MATNNIHIGLAQAVKGWVMHQRRVQHVYQNIFRITANNNDRVTASGITRITAKSDY